jgi:murein DD-endopeptidase MepM/ murein hydrolase activator NlpD
LVVDKSATGFAARTETAPLVATSRLAGGMIRSSLFAATDDARIPDAVAVQVAELFASDIDFHRALRKGDRFNVVYETLEADNEPLRAGRVISAEFVNNGKTYQAVWFQEPGSKGQYYTLEGNTLRKAFLASPLEFSRITSGFGGRTHPISRLWKMHTGVDYAAPTGTPVRTVGDGVVDFAGVQRGYGNVIEIKHRDGKNTLFAHLSRIGVTKGQKVEQGQVIGAVGTTGYSTGPHLHFEFRVNGEHHDPLTIAKESNSIPLSAAARPVFNRMVADVRLKLQAAGSMSTASAQ